MKGAEEQVEERTLPKSIKIITTCLLVIPFFLFMFLYQAEVQTTCIIDELHEILYPINREIACCAWRQMMGFSQVMMDSWVLFIMVFWIFWNQNVRFPTAIALTFFFRILYMKLVAFPYPDDIVWKDPGFFSFSVAYNHTRDFFFSGHTTSILLIFLETLHTKRPLYVIIPCAFSVIFMIWMLITVRIHYTIDVVAAIIHSLYMYGFVIENLESVDWAWSLPMMGVLWMREKCRGEENQHMKLEEQDQ